MFHASNHAAFSKPNIELCSFVANNLQRIDINSRKLICKAAKPACNAACAAY